MGQGPSSIDYNYVYKEKKDSVDKKIVTNNNKQVNKKEIDRLNSLFNELLNVLKYHTNMFAIDKNFVLKNKLINTELDEKIKHLKKELTQNKDEYTTLSESFRIDQLENSSYDRYNICLKYINIFMFLLIVVLVAIRFLKTRSDTLNI